MRLTEIILSLSLTTIVTCKSRKAPMAPGSAADVTRDISNAEKFCKEHGGALEVFRVVEGDPVRSCVFGNARIDLMTLYNAKHSEAVAVFLSGSSDTSPQIPQLGSPAAAYCQARGGQSKAAYDNDGEFSFCEFSDKSMIEEWTLFRSASSPDNEKLKAALTAARS